MEHLHLKITRIHQETTHSKTYVVQEISGKQISYRAGQFLTLIVQLHGKEVRRSYSISSAPGVDEDVFFTIKRLENGELSRYLLDTLHTGDIITTLPPTGRFTIDHAGNETFIFIAAGSGITPVFSLVKYLLYCHSYSKAILIYQNSNEQQSIFRSHLLLLAAAYAGRFTLHEVFSHPTDHRQSHKRLNNSLLENTLLHFLKHALPKFYLCGPESFMRMAQFTLRAMGYGDDIIKKENFFATPPPPPFITDTAPHTVTIHFHNQVHLLQVAYPQTILDAALGHNIMLPYSCRGGRCSTCTAVCRSGTVKMSINDVLTEKDMANGLVLPCVAYPENDVEISFD